MEFIFGRQDMPTLERAQENCFLCTNGLGGYASLSAAFSMTRSDHGLLVSARTAPNDRVTLVARLQETLLHAGQASFLSTQQFADGRAPEEGWRRLSALWVEDTPRWAYDVQGIRVTREVAMARECNAVAVRYTIENRTALPCTLQVRPFVLGFGKGHAPLKKWHVSLQDGCITANGQAIHLRTNGALQPENPCFHMAAYMHDAPDGRPERGLLASVCCVDIQAEAGCLQVLELVFADDACSLTADEIIAGQKRYMQDLREQSGLKDPLALQLACAADAYVARRASTGGKTILAGYPFFGDWGRDTMIALPGCTLATRRFDDARSILRTFLQYEHRGLVPNLFPEGAQQPLYNTVDAALLLIVGVYQYVQASGDTAFIAEALPVLERIVNAYCQGTDHGIAMDADGLIRAGEGLDQVTWMDVRVGEILPTPRHGKPVEINAYWYCALRIMQEFTGDTAYGDLAVRVKVAFLRAFWMEDKRYLRDVVSGTAADEQIRCNQIWAVTMPYSMLSPEQERAVVDTVYAHLYTPCGLRTLSPADKEYHGMYCGVQAERDMAYHQGTAWVFPLGAYYLAYLKVYGPAAAPALREALAPMAATLREGCIGQLPEIYDGDAPSFSRGCFAQAWSVGEILRVLQVLETL